MHPVAHDVVPRYRSKLVVPGGVEVPEAPQVEVTQGVCRRLVQVPLGRLATLQQARLYRVAIPLVPELPQEPPGQFPASTSMSRTDTKFEVSVQ